MTTGRLVERPSRIRSLLVPFGAKCQGKLRGHPPSVKKDPCPHLNLALLATPTVPQTPARNSLPWTLSFHLFLFFNHRFGIPSHSFLGVSNLNSQSLRPSHSLKPLPINSCAYRIQQQADSDQVCDTRDPIVISIRHNCSAAAHLGLLPKTHSPFFVTWSQERLHLPVTCSLFVALVEATPAPYSNPQSGGSINSLSFCITLLPFPYHSPSAFYLSILHSKQR